METKKLLRAILGIVLIISTSTFARPADAGFNSDECDCNHNKKLRGLPADSQIAALGNMRSIASNADITGYRKLGGKICNIYESSDDLESDIPKLIYAFMKKEEGMRRPHRKLDQVLEKLSENKHDLKCANGDDIIARAFSRGLHYTVMNDIFLGSMLGDDTNYDFNAVTITYNPYTKQPEEMTVLDFIEKIALNDKGMSGGRGSREWNNLFRFKEMLKKEFGAKNFQNFNTAERADYERNATTS